MMKKKTIALVALSLAANAVWAQSWPKAAPEAKPGARWWWLGSAVNNTDLRWNMQQYSQTGLGALEITPIYGVQGNDKNDIPFLSPKWMETLRFVESEGARDSILVDMNTGTGWPFGSPETPLSEAAAKLVVTDITVTGKELRSGVDVSVKDDKEKPYAQLSRTMAFADDGTAIDLTQLTNEQGTVTWKKAAKKATYRVIAAYCSRTRQKVKRAAPGGEGYVIDHFDSTAVAHYLQRFTKAFEETNTPYPNTFFNDSYEVYQANWTPKMFDEFAKRRGYKLEDHLLELLGYKDDGNKTLADYRETMGELLLENFTEQWTAWANSHGAKTRNQAHGSPANLIDVYSAVDIPEIEGFGLSEFGIKGLRRDSGFTKKNFSDVSMLKYASSAAHINGKRLTSSETFTWLTEHFRTSLSQCKPDIDLMMTCGVNNMYFHGTAYSPKNDPWPGWKFYASIDMSPTNSIWRDAPYFMKYVERCQSFLQMGQPDNDFLVLLPVRDMWRQRKGEGPGSLLMMFDIHSMEKKAPDFIKSILEIDKAGFDCDYISEKYLLSTTFKDGMLQTSAGTRYKALIITGKIFPDNVKAHIDALRAQGANIIYGTAKADMDKSATAERLKHDCGLRLIRRKNDTGYHYFIANLQPTNVCQRVPLAVKAKDARWFNPMDGTIHNADLNADGLMVNLRSGESMILQTYDNAMPTKSAEPSQLTDIVKPLNGKWTLNFVESAPKVLSTFALDSLTTWETLDDDSAKVTMGTGRYATTVKMTKQEAQQRWAIDLGDVRESARVYVNGKYVGCAWAVPFTLECGKAFRAGSNEIAIEVTNLPANRIAQLDRDGVKWRKFKEINVVDLQYKKATYANWQPVKSGLNSPVKLVQIR